MLRRAGIRDGIRGRRIVGARKVPCRRIGIGVVLRKVRDRIGHVVKHDVRQIGWRRERYVHRDAL